MQLNLLNFPNEINSSILSFLPEKELFKVIPFVCKRFKELASYDLVWVKPLQTRRLSFTPGQAKSDVYQYDHRYIALFVKTYDLKITPDLNLYDKKLFVQEKISQFYSPFQKVNSAFINLLKSKLEGFSLQELEILLMHVKQRGAYLTFGADWDGVLMKIISLYKQKSIPETLLFCALDCLQPSLALTRSYFKANEESEDILIALYRNCAKTISQRKDINFKQEIKKLALEHHFSSKAIAAIEEQTFQFVPQGGAQMYFLLSLDRSYLNDFND